MTRCLGLCLLLAIVCALSCADSERPRRVNLIVAAWEARGYEYVGADEEWWYFLDYVERVSPTRRRYHYLAVSRHDEGETERWSQREPLELDEEDF